MTKEQQLNCSWLGLLQIAKPAKGEQVGFAYADWHHFAIIDNYVILYIWDSREIIDAFPKDILTNFTGVKLSDNGKQLYMGDNTSSRARRIVHELLAKYDLPIIETGGTEPIADLHERAAEAAKTVCKDFTCINEDLSIVFVPKTMQLPDNLYMYKLVPTLNDAMYKLCDSTAYLGRAKHYAVLAHVYVLQTIEQLNA